MTTESPTPAESPRAPAGLSALLANLSATGVLAWLCLVQVPQQQARFVAELDAIRSENVRQVERLGERLDLTQRTLVEIAAEMRSRRLGEQKHIKE